MPGRVTPYRPAKGDEGDAFYASLCSRCRADREDAHPCTLLIRGLLLKGRQLFPSEWVQDDAGPMCTAFAPKGGHRNAPPAPEPVTDPGPAQLAFL